MHCVTKLPFHVSVLTVAIGADIDFGCVNSCYWRRQTLTVVVLTVAIGADIDCGCVNSCYWRRH